jgi:predicted Zn-dependent protease
VKLFAARESDTKNPVTYAYIAEAAGLQTLLYGTDPVDVISAMKNIGKELKPGAAGAREVVIGRAALELSRLHTSQTPGTVLASINKPLDDLLKANEQDNWARWLRGRSHLAAGERGAARAAFKKAADGTDGLVVALVDLANLDVDDGKIESAMGLFKQAVAKGKELHVGDSKANDHPLAVLGKSLARAEGQFETDEAIAELNDNFDEGTIKDQPRSVAYRALIRAILNGVENYASATEELKKAIGGTPPGEARFWSRVAWIYSTFGKTQLAKKALEKVTANKAAEPDPTVELVDSALTLADGDPERALDRATKLEGVRAGLIRSYAFLDLDKGTEALAEADKVLAVAKGNVEAQILREQARMYSEKDREGALKELESLARRAKSKLGRHALGVSLLKFGDKISAKSNLEQAAALDETSPNPLLYRTHTALAELAILEQDPARAGKHIDEALALNAEFFPTLMMRVRAVLLNNEPDRALTYIQQLTSKPAFASLQVQLIYAEVLARAKTPPKDKELAKQIIIKLKDADIDPAQLARVAAFIDPNLVDELDLPEGEDKPKDKPKRRRRK